MRPQHNTAEDSHNILKHPHHIIASMRPQHNTAEDSAICCWYVCWLCGFNEAAA